jgi:hypothetical protein
MEVSRLRAETARLKREVEILKKATAYFAKDVLWRRMRLIMAGPADGGYAGELKALSRRLGVDDCIYWCGMLMGDDKWGGAAMRRGVCVALTPGEIWHRRGRIAIRRCPRADLQIGQHLGGHRR